MKKLEYQWVQMLWYNPNYFKLVKTINGVVQGTISTALSSQDRFTTLNKLLEVNEIEKNALIKCKETTI